MRVLTPTVIAFGVTALRDLVETKKVRFTVIVGGFLMGALLFAINEVSPEVALAFGWVTAITALFLNGVPVFKAIQGGLS